MEISHELLSELYLKQKLSHTQIANKIGISKSTVRRLCIKYAIPSRNVSQARKIDSYIEISKEVLKELYLKDKLSQREIAKKLDCSPSTIKLRMKKFGINARKSKNRYKDLIEMLSKELLIKMYWNDKRSVIEIASEFKTSRSCIYNLMNYYKINRRSASEAAKLRYKKHTFFR